MTGIIERIEQGELKVLVRPGNDEADITFLDARQYEPELLRLAKLGQQCDTLLKERLQPVGMSLSSRLMTELYVIEEPKQLVGKTIAYVELNRFSNPLILTTADGGIMAWRTENYSDFDEMSTEIYTSNMVEIHLFNSRVMKKELIEKGICTQQAIDEFLYRQLQRRQKEAEKYKQQQEERDKQEFERLKQKFADVDGNGHE